ncbi:hypothetical protein UA08_04279 [Talaromyces atroroseus]|uniref:RAVE subunit 2/Rogdi n=1 Tax=Talaromyces atroroseus TaxID=1441469 RepID=A0A1Q5Q9W9_TALAT|nr:hypothetical protein UA08_04279 [Talaromyces atroroseus]OKL60760.1 hypothetical protein UA08_04279 [Talaromyces atroroseus]
MATWAYPPLPAEQLQKEEETALSKELEWLLAALQESLVSLREGLQECAGLLAPREPGSTLVLSSVRSESVKGFVTRIGTRIVKGDIQLRLASLPPSRGANSTRLNVSGIPGAPELVLYQLAAVRNLINQGLDVIDVSTFTGDPLNASFISGQLRLLYEHISEAKSAIKGGADVSKWWELSAESSVFDPPTPSYLSFHLTIADAALVLHLRTLEPISPNQASSAFGSELSLTGFSLRDKIFGPRLPPHDELGEVFVWQGEEVRVKEKIRVESQDPSLIAVLAKLSALEHEVMKCRASLKIVMGDDDGDSDV